MFDANNIKYIIYTEIWVYMYNFSKYKKPCKLCNSLVILTSQLLETVSVLYGEVYVFYLTLYCLKSSKRLTKWTFYYDYRMTRWKSWLVLTLYFMKSSKRLTKWAFYFGYRMTRWKTWLVLTWSVTDPARISGNPAWNTTPSSDCTFPTPPPRKSSPWDPSSGTGESQQTGVLGHLARSVLLTWCGVVCIGHVIQCFKSH